MSATLMSVSTLKTVSLTPLGTRYDMDPVTGYCIFNRRSMSGSFAPQRKSGMTGRTAAVAWYGECPLWG